ncbi:UTRA domain-containing protein [Nonomuraea sp. ZG12]|uniref:UTRA domain-containing protein n=1 Tax=Nonomuraea sp. ZG12 TaxID=3452207 RepID=UPI003F8C73D5
MGDAPVQLDEAIYPRELVEGTPIATGRKVPGGIYVMLAQAGHSPVAVTRRTMRARIATENEAARLKLAKGSLVLAADQLIADERGRVSATACCCSDSARWTTTGSQNGRRPSTSYAMNVLLTWGKFFLLWEAIRSRR